MADYTYNIHGWLTGINALPNSGINGLNGDLFAQEINYNEQAQTTSTFTTGSLNGAFEPQYNGNIAATRWHTDQQAPMAYLFEYDGLNRLKQAQDLSYSSSWSLENHFETSYTYDRNGNFGFLTRKGKTAGTYDQPPQTFGLIDDLSYSYAGNQLMQVEDDVSGSFPDLDHFVDGNTGSNDYDYDKNGNLTRDRNQDITGISYNHFNKPTEITFSSGQKIGYIYAADGTKLRQKVFNGLGTLASYHDYVGPVHYENPDAVDRPQIAFIAHAEGRLRPVGGEMVYEYVLRDHLGNTRVTFGDLNDDESPEILQQDHYYPFGLSMKTSGALMAAPPNQYRYNGKELQDELGLNWIDYGARLLNPMIGRWNGVDPLAELAPNFTPYRYGFNNPIKYIDPNGMYEGEAGSWNRDDPEFADVLSYWGVGTSSGDNQEQDGSSNEEEDCCPGMGIGAGIVRMQNAQSISEITGDSYERTYLELTEAEIKAGMQGIAEGALIITGEYVFVKTLQAGRYIWVAYRVKRASNIPKIVSFGQRGLRNPAQIATIKEAMLNGTFKYSSREGMIAGWLNNGKYIIGEGHHRMAAALEILRESGNATPVLELLKNGAWSPAKYGGRTSSLPARTFLERFANWLGF